MSKTDDIDEQIIKNINDMVELTEKIKQGMCDIERNLIIAQDAFTHAKTLTQDQVDLMVTE